MMRSISRRTLLTQAGYAGAATVVGSMLPRSAWALPSGFAAGIQLYTVSKPLGEDAPGTLKRLHEIGYREVETAGLMKHTAKEFRGFLDDAGLVCPSAHLQLTEGDPAEQF